VFVAHADVRPARFANIRRAMSNAFRIAAVLPCIALALATAGCGETSAPSRTLALADCHLPKVAQTLQCGTLEVPENRTTPGGRKIKLAITVLPANTLSPRPDPLFILAGGPGQAASAVASFPAQLTDIRATRDIVLVDQRGTGLSSPLTCKAFAQERDLATALQTDVLAQARECAAELNAQGVDAAQYTTDAFIEDLEDVRRALGYPTVNLWGGSYGTRVAQEYLRRHPEVIRSVVLDGVAPPHMIISTDIWPTRQKVVDDVIAACGAAAACAAAHPDLGNALMHIQQSLGADGQRIEVALPRTGKPAALRINWPAVIGAIHPLSYQPETAAMIPVVLGAAVQGNFAPLLATFSLSDDDADTQLNNALFYSVTCAEDVPRLTTEARARALADPQTRGLISDVLAVCDFWPRGALPADFATPVVSGVPVLLISGGLDPVTPPAYATEVARTLSHSRTLVAPGFGHIVSSRACGPQLLAKFVDRAGFDTLPASCVDFLQATTAPLLWSNALVAGP
jgi:pimeloyl-ACP methyl ester carboxylesterase